MDEQIKNCNCPRQFTQLFTYKQEIENHKFTTDNLLYQLKGSACDWDENTWTLRLANDLKLNQNGTKFTANDAFYQCELSNNIVCRKAWFTIYFIEEKFISTATVARGTPTTDDSSSDESLSLSLQRPPMKSSVMDIPEKLGEVIGSSYILLVCKLIRKVLSGKPIIDESTVVKGLLLDKILGAIHVEVIGRVSQPNEKDRIHTGEHLRCLWKDFEF